MPFGPGDLLYELYGDRRGYLVGPCAGFLQLMYSPLGRGVIDHSDFYNEPLERLFRSVPQIQGTLFDGDRAEAQAAKIREFHRDIKGSMPDGSRYHALDPDTYFWAHATFIDAVYRTTDLFRARPLNRAQKVRVYEEGVRWWQMYGMSMRPVPPTYDDFLDYWEHTLHDGLEVTPAARGLRDFLFEPRDMPQPWLPAPVWRAVGPAIGISYREVVAGTIPPNVREMLGLKWTRRNEVAFQGFRLAVAYTWEALPYHARIMPRARAAYRRQGRLGVKPALTRHSLAGDHGILPSSPQDDVRGRRASA